MVHRTSIVTLRKFVVSLSLLLLASLFFGLDASAAPHICVILVDDMGYGDPGCFNPESKIATPHIDSLARDGMRFTDAHAPGPLCHMSRYGLLTGCYPFRTDVSRWPTQPLIDRGQTTIASLAKSQGYRTAMVGKWHLGFHEQGYDVPLRGGPVDRGFDSFFGIRASTDIPPYFYIRGDRAVEPPTEKIAANRSDGGSPVQGKFWRAGKIAPDLKLEEVLPRFTEEAIAVIEGRAEGDTNEPLMLYLAYPAPHTPWLPSEEFEGKSGAGMYGDFVTMVDAEIGRVLAALESAGMTDDTLVVFTSDNGPVWRPEDTAKFDHDSTGGWRGMKGDAWEAGHRMPFVVRWPGVVAPGSETAETISFTDLLATFADVMGADLAADAGVDSYSFLPVLAGEHTGEGSIRPPMVVQAGSRPQMMSIRGGDWKLITGLGSGGFTQPSRRKPSSGEPPGQLYNLAVDPAEQDNVYEQHPKIVAQATEALEAIVATGTRRPAPAEATGEVTENATDTASVDPSMLQGKVMCGYQGWFNTPGDGMELGWKHWARNGYKPFGPDNLTVDLWPDMSEMEPDERFDTEFRHADGRVAEVYSSTHPRTILRHFEWMQQYGIDGAFLQRFANGVVEEKLKNNKDRVLAGVRQAAETTGRSYVVMYDLSGLPAEEGVSRVINDWKELHQKQAVTSDRMYQRHNGKPLVAVWGIGFSDRSPAPDFWLDEYRNLIVTLKESGCSVMVGVPTRWRTLSGDAIPDKRLHEVLKLADVVSPWTPGRYRTLEGVAKHAETYWRPDKRWCDNNDLAYLPVTFPGFSWHNLKGKELGEIPRLKGQFLWSQFVAAKRSGAEMIYVAMFDEVDEGTAIFKCTNDPPVGEGFQFLTYDELPSDHYLWLTGQAGRMLRGELRATDRFPRRRR